MGQPPDPGRNDDRDTVQVEQRDAVRDPDQDAVRGPDRDAGGDTDLDPGRAERGVARQRTAERSPERAADAVSTRAAGSAGTGTTVGEQGSAEAETAAEGPAPAEEQVPAEGETSAKDAAPAGEPDPLLAPAPVSAPGPDAVPSGDGVAVRTEALTKRFRGQLAVDGLDLVVPRGSVFGFLGPNGSGKTTTIRMLLGLIEPSSGSARLLGEPMPRAANRVLPRVGALIEGPALYGFLSGRENLRRFDTADPTADPATRTRRIERALERVGLSAAASKKARAYSLGMKQRLGLAAALLQPRELLVLDEPTNGLDPQGMREIRALVRELAREGSTVFLSSHLLDEIEQVCTHVAVMAKGRLITQGTVAALAASTASAQGRLVVTTPDPSDAVRVLKEHGVSDLVVADERVTGELPTTAGGGDPVEDIALLNAALVRAGVRVRGFGTERASLEDIFVSLTGEGFDVAG